MEPQVITLYSVPLVRQHSKVFVDLVIQVPSILSSCCLNVGLGLFPGDCHLWKDRERATQYVLNAWAQKRQGPCYLYHIG